jgi:hypothetical protein
VPGNSKYSDKASRCNRWVARAATLPSVETHGLGLFCHPSGVTMLDLTAVDRIGHDPDGVELQGDHD